MGVAAVLAVALALRLAAIALGPGLPYDVGLFQDWAARMAAGGPAAFYDPARFADYPPALLYLLWPLGLAFGTVPPLAIRLLPIPFDLAILSAIMGILARVRTDRAWLVAGLAYALNPAVVLAGPYWGQLDAVPALLALLALVAAASRRFALAGALAGVAALAKPQAALIFAPLAVVGLGELIRRRDGRPLGSIFGSSLVTAVVVLVPFAPTPERIAAFLRDAFGSHALSGIFVLNLWSFTAGLSVPESAPLLGLTVGAWGLLLFGAALAGILVWLWRRLPRDRAFGAERAVDLGLLLGAAALAQIAFYELAPRIHERYLFPAFALLAPLAVTSATAAVAYVVLTVVFAASLLMAFALLEPGLAFIGPTSPLLDPGLLTAIAVAGLGAAAALALHWWRRPPSLA
jgi:hypothetical protein